jgi:hypothetical protein
MITSGPLHASADGSGSVRMGERRRQDHAAGSDAKGAGTNPDGAGSTLRDRTGVPNPDPVQE